MLQFYPFRVYYEKSQIVKITHDLSRFAIWSITPCYDDQSSNEDEINC